jgi:hypothetical protein
MKIEYKVTIGYLKCIPTIIETINSLGGIQCEVLSTHPTSTILVITLDDNSDPEIILTLGTMIGSIETQGLI